MYKIYLHSFLWHKDRVRRRVCMSSQGTLSLHSCAGGAARRHGVGSLEVLALAGLSHLVTLQLVVLDDCVGDGVKDLRHGIQVTTVAKS